uniref:Uncharacterized protein n=1 Tax=Siphoviridae sp. ctuy39 TaxID=2825719 RepID=A0A8S5VEK0_9CAUD|nr:MAG TPA: hypothetical protein [Siphoviridae sp. ctuy39]
MRIEADSVYNILYHRLEISYLYIIGYNNMGLRIAITYNIPVSPCISRGYEM